MIVVNTLFLYFFDTFEIVAFVLAEYGTACADFFEVYHADYL